jgi:phosphate-selective porin OprO/OprP
VVAQVKKVKLANHHENRFAALEGIFAKGPFKLQAEYGQGKFEGKNEVRGNGAEADVKIGYIVCKLHVNW